MKIFRVLLIVIFLFFIGSTIQAQEDSVRHTKDSVIEIATDPTTLFFQSGERISTPAKTILITAAKKTISLAALQKNENMMMSDHTLADLDNDGKKELIIYNFTGGAHCCDEIYIFKNIAVNKYQQVAKLFAGNTIITSEKEFIYDFHEQFGYFFTCFACGYSDTSDEAPIQLTSIKLKYNKGKLMIMPGDKELRSTINDNLGKLGEQPYEKPDDDLAQDNGLRKEFALNLAVFYYSFGKNLPETQKLFNKYYKYPDAKKVWTAFAKELLYIPKQSTL